MNRMGTAVLFPGQGSQAPGMGRRAAEQSPAAAVFFDDASTALDRDLRELCWHSSIDELTRTENLQPALTVAALAAWIADGNSPRTARAAAGHSVGALSAAAVAGAISPVVAVQLASTRGRFMASVAGGGTMLAVATNKSFDERAQFAAAIELASQFDVEVAAINGPTQVVLSGSEENIAAAADKIGGRSKPLKVSNAFHSRFMEPVAADWAQTLERIEFADGHGYVGCVSGAWLSDGDHIRADLREGLTSPVRWAAVMTTLATCAEFDVYGPGRAIARLARPYLDGRPIRIHEGAAVR